MGFAEEDLTRDGFLGGKVVVRQPRKGYRAGVDPVFLAAAVPARPGESVLELGCGAGAALLCLGHRVAGLMLAGIEVQPDFADLARRNAVENGAELEIVEGDITTMPATLRDRQFDHVIANPPYFDRRAGSPADDPGRETARGEGPTDLRDWLDAGARRLKPGGRLTLIYPANRLAEVLAATPRHLGGTVIQPLAPRSGRDATLVIVASRKDSRTPLRLRSPQVIHDGAAHEQDGDDYSAAARAVLRDGSGWPGIGD